MLGSRKRGEGLAGWGVKMKGHRFQVFPADWICWPAYCVFCARNMPKLYHTSQNTSEISGVLLSFAKSSSPGQDSFDRIPEKVRGPGAQGRSRKYHH